MPAAKRSRTRTKNAVNVRKRQGFAGAAEQLSVLNAIASEASRALDIPQLLGLALDQMVQLTGMEGGIVLLVDEQKQQLTPAASKNMPRAVERLLQREPLQVGTSIPGIAAERCQLLVVEDSKEDERELPVLREMGMMTHVCIPLAVRGSALGVLGMIDHQRRSFSAGELALFTAVGEQLGIAIERTRLFDRQTALAKRLEMLNELMRIAVSSPDMAEVFDRVAGQVKRLIDHDRLSIAVRPPDEDYVEVYALTAKARSTFDAAERLPLRESPMGEAILKGRPVVRKNAPEDSTYPIESVIAGAEGYRSMMFVPLESKGRVIGTLNLGSREQAKYSEREVQVAQEIADHLAVIVEHAWLYRESKELAKLQERNRLANEIHDTLAQSLIGIILELDLSERMLRTDVPAARQELEQAREMARAALDEARRSVLALRPSALENVSLSEAVARQIQTLERDGVTVAASVSGEPVAVTNEVETALYRITQEAVANIRKHAKATRVEAVLDYGQEALTLTVSDNGAGFDPAFLGAADDKGGFGLTSMRERAVLAAGELRVESTPGQGTRISVHIPYAPASGRQPQLQPEAVTAQPAGAPPIRVLVADDHVAIREGIRKMLEEADDIEVVAEAADGTEALEKARVFRPDVVVTDVQMPRMGGIELVEALKAEGLPGRAIILTAHLQGDLIVRGMEAGAQGYLLKDIRGPELVGAVRAVHNGETFLQPAAASELARRVGAAGQKDTLTALTPRELEVLGLLARGLRNKEIAKELALSEATVRFHVAHVFEKLDVGSRTEAVTKALQLRIISQP